MNDNAIDQAILSMLALARGRWRKVAMVTARVADQMGKDLPAGDFRYDRVAQRAEGLVHDGRLVAQGSRNGDSAKFGGQIRRSDQQLFPLFFI
jgi:hypothetical protein